MTFKYPAVFFLMILLGIVLYWTFISKSTYRAVRYPLSFRGLAWPAAALQWRRMLPLLLRSLACLCLVAALARPQTVNSTVSRTTEGIDIMLTLDVSKSMLIEDYGDDNRLNVAKHTIKKFIKGRLDDRIGFVMFSGESVTLCPPTLDYDVVLKSIDRADVDLLRDGTAIGDAIANSVNRLKDSRARSRIIILVTDGDSNMGSIAPLTAGSLAAGYGIKIYSIAIGTEGLVSMPVYEDFFGQTRKRYQQVNSTINPELLQKLSQESGGKFFRSTEKASLDAIFKEIDTLEKTAVEKKERSNWKEQFQIPLLIGLLLLVLEYILGRTSLRILPN